MGASSWDYIVPYREDFSAALHELREKALADGDYHWPHDLPRPKTLADIEKIEDESVWETGFHSILDIDKVTTAEPKDAYDIAVYHAARPVTPAELASLHIDKPVQTDVADLRTLATVRSCGRLAVIHDDEGVPTHLYFFGYSGD